MHALRTSLPLAILAFAFTPAVRGVSGVSGVSVPLSEKHSAEFNFPIQKLSNFYAELVEELVLNVPAP